jgi:predicted transcriptional regulator
MVARRLPDALCSQFCTIGERDVIRGKTRLQLFLPDDMSRRLAAMAKTQRRARSDLLVEMVEAWMTRRTAPQIDDRIVARLDRIARAIDEGNRETAIVSHSLQRFIRHQLIYSSALPTPGAEAQAAGERRYQNFLESISRSIGGAAATIPADGTES